MKEADLKMRPGCPVKKHIFDEPAEQNRGGWRPAKKAMAALRGIDHGFLGAEASQLAGLDDLARVLGGSPAVFRGFAVPGRLPLGKGAKAAMSHLSTGRMRPNVLDHGPQSMPKTKRYIT